MPIYAVNTNRSLFVVRMDSANNTVGVLGIIKTSGTTGRPSPPQPHNGFNTAFTPFGNGHVLALSLGGTDEARNIVPQWEQWQQTGEWRKVEAKCERLNGQLFRCDIAYDASAVNSYANTRSQFAQNPLIVWSHPGLPTSFRVRVYNLSTAAAELAGLGNEQAYDAYLQQLNAAKAGYDSGKLDHSAMPPEDRNYWQDKIIFGQAKELHATFEKDESTRVGKSAQVLVSTISFADFVLHNDTLKALKRKLGTLKGFSPTDVAGLQTNRILTATHKVTSTARDNIKKTFIATFLNKDKSHKPRKTATVARQKTARELRVENKRRGG